MAKISRSLSAKVNGDGTSEIYLRVSVGRGQQFRVRSGIFVPPARFRNGDIIMPRTDQREINRLRAVVADLQRLEDEIINYCLQGGDISKESIGEMIDRYHHPERYDGGESCDADFFELWEEFIESRELSKNRRDIYRSLARALHRYEMHRRQTREPDYKLRVDTITADDITDFERFYRDEWQLYDEYPDIYMEYPAAMRLQHKTNRPQRRGDNIVCHMLRKIRTFMNWCCSQGLTDNRPFDKYGAIRGETYGTPFYLTIAERDRIAEHDFTDNPYMAQQRDIFIFQCLVGCRVSDLRHLTKSNIIGDMLEYIPIKTKKERAETVRVPLCERAQQIIARYAGGEDDRLLPFISDQRYNDYIKRICKQCGIDRQVTVIDPVSGKDERRPIHEVASSHMARRTFIGNLYKQIKDPNLIGSMSGHKEGSKAFVRYREIDDDIKRGLIDLIK